MCAKQYKIPAREQKRLKKLTAFEDQARSKGYNFIAGVDEAGRGPLAGPVYAAVCIIPENVWIEGVNDSKQLTAPERQELYQKITSHPDISYAYGSADVDVIDRINILQATIQAMLMAISKLPFSPDLLLVDGLQLPHPSIPVQKIIKGDSLSQSIAAASIIAKETRDRVMRDYHQQWPEYGSDQHKGYGTESI